MSEGKILATKKLTLKERIRFIFLSLFFIIIFTGALIFFTNTAGVTIVDIFTGVAAVDYSWRDVFAVLYLPVMGYFDVLALLSLFFPFTLRLARLWGKGMYILTVYAVLAFVLTLPLSLYISFFPLDNYYSCGLRGPFSGVYYVKNRNMCKQFEYHPEKNKSEVISTSVIPTDKK